MRKPSTSLLALGAAAALALSACSSSGGNSGGSNPSGSGGGGGSSSAPSGTAQGACKLSNPPKSQAKAPTLINTKVSGHPKVGVILPDTTSSTRYTLYDKPLLTQYLSAAGITPIVQNAQGSKSQFAAIAQNMIGSGVKVLIIDSIDAPSGAGVEKAASQAGVKVIDYDRVNLGGTAPYYVSFDNQEVGRLQAQTLVDCLNQDHVTNPKIIMVDGGTDVDNNAVLFAKGAHQVLDPLQKAGKLKIEAEVVDKGWDVNQAAPVFTQALTGAGGSVDGVVAANDDIANAVVGVLKTNGLNGHVVVTGQDAGVEGLQNIVTGQQSMTVFKNVKYEAQAAVDLAITLLKNQSPSTAGLTLTPFNDPQSPSHHLQALLLPPQVITQANVNDVIKAGALTAKQICANIQSACTKLGIK